MVGPEDEPIETLKALISDGEAMTPSAHDVGNLHIMQMQRMRVVIVVMMVVSVFLFGGIVALRAAQADVERSVNDIGTQTARNREQGFKNAAKTCSVMISTGTPLTEDCKDANITAYYDANRAPSIPSSQIAHDNAVRLCEIEIKLSIVDLSCVQDPTKK